MEKLSIVSPNAATSLGQSIDWRAKVEELRPIYLERYELAALTNAEVFDIERAEKEQAQCEECDGAICHKREGTEYLVPKICAHDGELWIPVVRCPIGEGRRQRAEYRRAGLPAKYATKTFDDYKVTEVNREAVQIAHWYAQEKPARSLYLYGECGSGKTFLTSLIAKEYIKAYKSVVFGDVPALMSQIKRTFDSKTENASEILEKFAGCDLLVLDDLGAGKVTDWVAGQLYEIINTRYNARKRLIVTSNFDLDGLNKRLSTADVFSAKRIVSRLTEMCEEAFFGTKDWRR